MMQTFKTLDAASYDFVTERFDYFTERLSLPLALRLISLAQINPHQNILDIGTGTGVVALQVAQIFEDVAVTGIDLSLEMLSKANEKATRLNLEQSTNFIQMDAEELQFENEKFDKVVSLFALLHFPNPLVALREMYRIIKPGGRIVIAIGSGIPLFSLSGLIQLTKKIPSILQTKLGKQLVAPHFLDSLVKENIAESNESEESDLAKHPHHNRPQTVVSLVQQAGFKVVQTDWHGHNEIIETPEEFWEIQRIFSSLSRKRLNTATPTELENLQKIFLDKCRQVQSKGGRLIYPFGAFYVIGQRPLNGSSAS